MSANPKYLVGDKIVWRGVICEICAIWIRDRDEPGEYIEYDVETLGGETVRVHEADAVPLQLNLF